MDDGLGRKNWKKRHRNRRFWSKALRKNASSLFKYARRLSNGDETKAQDLTQLVYERILRYLPRPESIRSTQHYLFRILYNCWTTSKPRVEEISLDEVMEQVVQYSALAVEPHLQENVELKQILERAYCKLAPRHPELKIIITMRLSGFTFNEIDAFLGRDAGFSRVVWRRYLNEVTKLLTPRRPRRPQSGDKEKPAA